MLERVSSGKVGSNKMKINIVGDSKGGSIEGCTKGEVASKG